MYSHTKIYKVHSNFEEQVKYKNIKIKSKDGISLNGYYFANSNCKVALIVHGLGISAVEMEQHIKLFCGMEYSVLAIDNRAHGESEGKYLTFGQKESEDIKCWVDYLVQKNPQFQIVILGISMGATATCLYASKCDCKNVKVVISDCAFSNAYEIFKCVSEKMILPAFGFFVPIMNIFIKHKIGYKLSNIDAIKSVKNTKIPILYIHGTKDNFVPPYMSKLLFNNTPKNLATIHFFKNSTHGTCLPDHPREYKKVVQEFLSKRI